MASRMALFGGTFDPVHEGHLAAAECARQQLNLDKIIFLPAAQSPFKNAKPCAGDADRLVMLQAALGSQPLFEISDWEIRRGGISYTVDAVRHFRQLYPDAEWYLLMGEDSYEGLDKWKESGTLRKMVRVVVAPRKTASAGRKDNDDIFLDMAHYDASSTNLRTHLASSAVGGEKVPKAVFEYIRQKKLYEN